MNKKQNSLKHNDGRLHRPASVNDNHEPFPQSQTSIAPTAPTPSAKARLRRTWPLALVVIGLGLTLAWLSIVGYGLIKLVQLTM
jgi:hypothetical protein